LSTQEAPAEEFTTVTKWRTEVKAADHVDVEVYDARRLAEFIVDVLFEHEEIGKRLAAFLPPLQRALDLHAATGTMPGPRSGSVDRTDVEDKIEQRLSNLSLVLVAGMSGIGKTVTALAVANRMRGDFAWPVWTQRLRVDDIADLAGAETSRGNMRVNLRTMLATRSCLVLLDDLQTTTNLEDLLEQLRDGLGPRARLMVTSQHVVDTRFTVKVELMDAATGRRVLERDQRDAPGAPPGRTEMARGDSAVDDERVGLAVCRAWRGR
jgi:hypothetical protein